jgi:hypothetical protein
VVERNVPLFLPLCPEALFFTEGPVPPMTLAAETCGCVPANMTQILQ